MPRIEFYYYADCPSHERALELLRDVLYQERVDAPIEIIEVTSDLEARLYHFYGSPTIHINGADIAPLPEGIAEPGLTCRAYRRSDGRISPLPPRELIETAVRGATAL